MNIYEALFNVQKELPLLVKDADNPHFGSKYVDLPSILKIVTPIFHKHGILVMQAPTKTENGSMSLQTTFVLVDAKDDKVVEPAMLTFTTSVPYGKETPQAAGSAITYMRRYALVSALSMNADEDDDGNKASAADKKVTTAQLEKIKKLAVEKNWSLENMLQRKGIGKAEDMSENMAADLIQWLKDKE